MEQTMQQDGIVPDAVEEEPSSKITISYSSGKSVEFGQELSPTDVKDEPEVKWEADPAKYYTLVMFDADGPNKEEPKFGDIKHWLVVNILGCDLSSGDVIAEYIGAEPSQGSGLHRYIFLVFEQKEKTTFDEPKSGKLSKENRLNWSMRMFKTKYSLGRAFAGNYFKAQWEPPLDEHRKHLTDTN